MVVSARYLANALLGQQYQHQFFCAQSRQVRTAKPEERAQLPPDVLAQLGAGILAREQTMRVIGKELTRFESANDEPLKPSPETA